MAEEVLEQQNEDTADAEQEVPDEDAEDSEPEKTSTFGFVEVTVVAAFLTVFPDILDVISTIAIAGLPFLGLSAIAGSIISVVGKVLSFFGIGIVEDIGQAILALGVVGILAPLASILVDMATGAGMSFYLIMKLGGKAQSKLVSRLAVWLVAVVIETFVPGLDVLPLRTITFLAIVFLTYFQEKSGVSVTALASKK